MQVFGGMGYIEETGVAQYYRDVRVTAIYEGTNGIQAMDLVGRKLADGGHAAHALIEEAEETARARRRRPRGAPRHRRPAPRGRDRLDGGGGAERPLRGAAPYLRAFALILGAHYLIRGALAEGREDGPRAALAGFHARRLLPEAAALCEAACAGAAELYAMDLGEGQPGG